MKKDSVKKYYEEEAEDYDRLFYVEQGSYPTLMYRHNYILGMVDELNLPSDATVLDIGCGPGEMVKDLAVEERTIHGIDIAQEMIDIAVERMERAGKNLEKIVLGVGDIEALDYPDQYFDLIVVSGVIEYLDDDVKWMREIQRTTKPGGYLIVNVTNKYAIRKWTSQPLERLKKWKPLYNLMDNFKQKVLRKGKLHHFPFTPRVHSPKGFDRYLADHGFTKLSHNYFDFSIFPAPFDTLLGFVTTPIKKSLERHSRKKMVLSGTGYIVAAQKEA